MGQHIFGMSLAACVMNCGDKKNGNTCHCHYSFSVHAGSQLNSMLKLEYCL